MVTGCLVFMVHSVSTVVHDDHGGQSHDGHMASYSVIILSFDILHN